MLLGSSLFAESVSGKGVEKSASPSAEELAKKLANPTDVGCQMLDHIVLSHYLQGTSQKQYYPLTCSCAAPNIKNSNT